MSDGKRLSSKSAAILSLIAEGHSYAQIVDSHPGITCSDIFRAAEEALHLCESHADNRRRLAEIKQRYPRAYEPWSPDDDSRLAAMLNGGASISELAAAFQRRPSAIRSRLARLGLPVDANLRAQP